GKIEEPGELTVQAGLLAQFVNLLDADQVELKSEGAKLFVTSGKQKTTIQGVDAVDFPVLPAISGGVTVRVDRGVLAEALANVSFSVVPNDVRPEIGGMYCSISKGVMTLAGTDSYRLAERTLPVSGDAEHTTIIPLRTVQELQRILSLSAADAPEIELLFTENQLRATAGSTQLISRAIEGTYPAYREIIPKTTNTQCVISRDQLLKAIKRSSLFCSSGINDLSVKFTLPTENNTQGTIDLSAQNAQVGTHEESVEAAITGKENAAVFNWRYVADGLQHINAPEVIFELVDSSSPGILRPASEGKRDYTYLVMPIRQ
ncbi:MAG: DNA polymerase III subunit beta, partial [bacterium]|nr:DNA polymerase III subunit beta [bacterium]